MTPEELLYALKQTDDSNKRLVLIQQAFAAGTVTYDDLQGEIADWLVTNDPYLLVQLGSVSNTDQRHAQNQKDAQEQSQLDTAAHTAATDPESPGGEAVTPEEKQQAEDEGASSTALAANIEPRWILEQYGPLTPEQQSRIVQDVATFYGQEFASFDELAHSGFLDDATAEVQNIIKTAVLDTPMETSWQMELPSGDLFTVKAADWAAVNGKYGIDERQLISLIKMADTLGVKDEAGRLDWKPMLALANITGLMDDLHLGEHTQILGGPGGNDMGVTPQRRVSTDTANPDRGTFQRQFDPSVNPNILRGEGLQIDNKLSYRDLVREYQTGLQKFGDKAMAYIYAYDPSLALRISFTGGDPAKIRQQDLLKVSAIFQDELNEEWFASSPLSLLGNYLQLEQARNDLDAQGKASKAETKTVRQKPDEASVNETLRQLYQQMFLEDPDEGTLAKFRAQISGAIDAMQEGDSVDISARAREFARQDPRYGQLYGHKPEHVSEEEYQGQFRAAQGSMLGNEVGNNDALLAGMRSGQYQTTVGAAAGTKEAWDNSTFLGRLARAGQVVGEMT